MRGVRSLIEETLEEGLEEGFENRERIKSRRKT